MLRLKKDHSAPALPLPGSALTPAIPRNPAKSDVLDYFLQLRFFKIYLCLFFSHMVETYLLDNLFHR